MGAVSSLGKTTLALQMADNLARSGRDVLIFSLEMSRFELMSKTISRLTFEQDNTGLTAKTNISILSGAVDYNQAEAETFAAALDNYKSFAENLYIVEGDGRTTVNDIRDRIKSHIEAFGEPPIVFVDYLQILAPTGERLTDKQNNDKNISELKRISRDYNAIIFVISSFNRDAYKVSTGNGGRVQMSDFKESGGIEYTADVAIGLQYTRATREAMKYDDEITERQKSPREIDAVIMKNRNGKAWTTASFEYYTMFNTYEEIQQADDNPFTETEDED